MVLGVYLTTLHSLLAFDQELPFPLEKKEEASLVAKALIYHQQSVNQEFL